MGIQSPGADRQVILHLRQGSHLAKVRRAMPVSRQIRTGIERALCSGLVSISIISLYASPMAWYSNLCSEDKILRPRGQ